MPYGDIFSFANNQKAQQAAQEPDDNYGMGPGWAPINSAPIDPNKPAATRTPASVDPYGSGPLPPNFGYQTALVKSGYGGTAAPIDLMPIQGAGVTQANAKAIGVATDTVNSAIANLPVSTTPTAGNGITVSSSDVIALANPIVDGNPIWQIDSAYYEKRDDFTFNGNGASAYIGEQGWYTIGSGVTFSLGGGGLPHPGVLQMYLNASTANIGGMLLNQDMTGAPATPDNNVLPILDYPGWKQTQVFQFIRPIFAENPSAEPFSMAHQSIYIGFGNSYLPSGTVLPLRPSCFLGMRYDYDAGFSMTVESIAAASGGKTVYTVNSTLLTGTNALAGNNITFAGCTSSANNGTYLCTASTGTTVTVLNAAGVLQSGAAGTAHTPAISDTEFVFEYVANPLNATTQRNNTQGQTSSTGVTPTEGTWYRLDIESVASGVVTLTLSSGGSQLATWTVTATPVLLGTTTASSATIQAGNNAITIGCAQTFNGTNMVYSPFGIGSQLTLGGTAPTGMTVGDVYTEVGSNAGQADVSFLVTGAAAGNVGCTLTGYPAFFPGWMGLSTDTTTSHVTYSCGIQYDFFAFVWNPGLAGQAVSTGYSRFFSGT